MTSSPVSIVGHTADLGGAEIALAALLRNSTTPLVPVLLERGPLTSVLERQGTPPQSPHRPLHPVGQLIWLRRWLRRNRPALVVSNTLRASLFVALVSPRETPHVVYLRDGVDADSLSPVKRVLARWAFRGARLVLANSEWTRRRLLDGSPETPSTVVYTTSGVSRATIETRGDTAIRPVGRRRIVFVGRLVEWKGPHLLLEALTRLREQRGDLPFDVWVYGVPLMGDPGYADALVAQSRRAGLGARFPGHVDVHTRLRAGDVLVHCSLRPEPFGQVVVQAAAAGLCVVAPRAGGPLEVLGQSLTETLYEMGDVADLARVIGSLADHPERVDEYARRARRVALGFTDERVAALFDAAIVDVIAHERGLRPPVEESR